MMKATALLLSSILFFSPLTTAVQAEQSPSPPPEYANEIYLPLQSVIYGLIDTLGTPLFLPKPQKNSSTDVFQIAIHLGLSTTDAIVALRNRDIKNFENFATAMYQDAERLHLSRNLLNSFHQIQAPLKKQNFKALETMMQRLHKSLSQELNLSYRRDQAKLAFVAGWLEGLYIASYSLNQKFSTEKAAKLFKNRSPLIGQLIEHMRNLHPRLHQRPYIHAMHKALPFFKKKLAQTQFSHQDIHEMAALCQELHAHMLSSAS